MHYVFAPTAAEMYPDADHPALATSVLPGSIAERFEGAARPGHFAGVLTVVLKLLQIVQPAVVVFGQKDAQQLALVRRMVTDFNLPVEVVAAPISREPDGLARSSRNRYLSPAQRSAAPSICVALTTASRVLDEGGSVQAALAAGRSLVQAEAVLELEYFELVDAATFEPSEAGTLLITVVRAGSTRLLDNLPVER